MYIIGIEIVAEDANSVTYKFTYSDGQQNTVVMQKRAQDEQINVGKAFGSHYLTGGGSASNVNYDEESGKYVLNGYVAVPGEHGEIKGDYAFYADVTPVSVQAGTEIVFSAVYAENKQIRFAMRWTDETHYLIFSDYKDGAKVAGSYFMNYKVHVDETEYTGETVRMGVIVSGNSMVMLYNGAVVYRRTLPSLSDTQLMINTYQGVMAMSGVEIESSAAEVTALYGEAINGYKDARVQATIINTSENIAKFVQNDDGSISASGLTSSKRIMGGLYDEGHAVAGYEYAVVGSFSMKGYGSGSAASKVELQICKDIKNFLKIQFFRYPTNNSLVTDGANNGSGMGQKYVLGKNTMPAGETYSTDFIIIYDCSGIKMWLRDGKSTPEYTLAFSLDVKWDYTFFCFAMLQYCDVTFTDMHGVFGEELDALRLSLGASESDAAFTVQTGDVAPAAIERKEDAYYIGGENEWTASVRNDLGAISGNYWSVGADISFAQYKAWTQGSLIAWADGTHAVRYVFEHTSSGKYQMFTQIKNGSSAWSDYTVIMRVDTVNALNRVSLVNSNGRVILLVNGYKYHERDLGAFGSMSAKIGGKGGIVKINQLKAITDEQTVTDIADNAVEYTYVSPYENKMKALETAYKDAETGVVLFAGSSTMEYWYNWQTDIGEQTLGYNVGIGGTIAEDWLYCYDRLIKKFNPSKIVLFLGGNNVNAMGHTGAYTVEQLKILLNKMHADFPASEIYYVYSLPVPNNYHGGKYTTEYGNLITGMKAFVAESDWLVGIDLESSLTLNGEPIAEDFRSDGIHLSDAGYVKWAQAINAAVFGN